MNGFQNPYLNLNPYGFQQMPTVYQQPVKQVEKVNGRNAAMQYPIGANSSAWILDESGTVSWLITTDSAGYKTVSAYDITPHQETPAPDYGNLESRIKRLEDMINGKHTTDSSAVRTEQHSGNDSASKTDDGNVTYRTEPVSRPEPTRYEQPKYETGNGYGESVRGRFDESVPGNR